MERQRGPAEAPNLGEPSTPRPSASVVLLRSGEGGEPSLEVLLLKRSERAAFMPSVWVFPGGSVEPGDGADEPGRRACAVRELAEEAAIELDGSNELVLFSRWITPEVITTRFDAWFFLALAPPEAPPRPDGGETVEAGWFRPEAALEAQATGELLLARPTVAQLSELLPFASSEEALAAYRQRRVEPILPKLVSATEGHFAIPGDPDYPA